MFFLPLDPPGQSLEIIQGVFEAVTRILHCGGVHQRGGTRPSAAGAIRDRLHHLQVA